MGLFFRSKTSDLYNNIDYLHSEFEQTVKLLLSMFVFSSEINSYVETGFIIIWRASPVVEEKIMKSSAKLC